MGAFATALQGIARPYVPNWTATYEGINALRDLQAKNALAGIYRQAIDPNTGAFDQSRFNAMVGQSPEASWNAGAAMQQSGQAMAAQGVGAQEQFNAQQQRLTALSGLATPFMERAEAGGSVSMEELSGLVDQARRANLITDGDVYQAKSLMTQPGANPTDILRGWYFRNYSALQQMSQAKGMGLPYQLTPPEALAPRVVNINGVPTTVPSGRLMGVPGLGGVSATGLGGTGFGGTAGLNVAGKEAALANIMQRESGGRDVPNAQYGEHAGGGYYQIVPSTWAEGKALAGIPANQYPVATGAPFAVQHAVASALWDRYGETPWAASAGNASRFSGFDAIQTARRNAFATPAPYQVASAGSAIPPPPTAAPGVRPAGGVQPGWAYPAPGEPELYGVSGKQYSEDLDRERTFARRTFPLKNTIELLASHPDLATGPGQSEWNSWMQALSAVGIPLPSAWQNPGYQGAWQELGKYLADWQMQQPGADQTDLSRMQNAARNPTTQMGRDAILTLAARAYGVELFQIAALQHFRELHPDNPDAYNAMYRRETNQWMRDQDLTAYAANLLPLEVTQRYYKSLDEVGKRRYDQSLVYANKYFGVNLPGIGGQGG